MEYEDIYEIVIRIQNARLLIKEGNLEDAEKVLINLEKDLKGVIYTNDPFKLLDELKRGE